MYPPSIQKLIDKFSKFPTVGPKTAARFVFHLLKTPPNEIAELIDSISNLKQSIKICSFCFNPFQGENNLCQICQDQSRDRTLLLIVEKEIDLSVIEKTKKYNGLYFILGGTVSTLKKEDLKLLRTEDLKERVENPQKFGISGTEFNEIIIATNPTPDGEATALYLERLLKPFNIKTARLGRGLPVGGELEYADEETLSSALESRR
jgi:recombination protein RecR